MTDSKIAVRMAKKYAAIFDDLAVKSVIDEEYWRNKRVAELLRALSELVEELEGA